MFCVLILQFLAGSVILYLTVYNFLIPHSDKSHKHLECGTTTKFPSLKPIEEDHHMKSDPAKALFAHQLKEFASTLGTHITSGDEWTIRGFVDIFKNVYTLSTDTKIISKVLELHLFPHFLSFAESIGYGIELATYQNWYPDLTFTCKADPSIKFAVDLKTTYRDDEYPGFCNGFTLGSHGEYFINRTSTKNIQHPYSEYSGHFCLGVIYSKSEFNRADETHTYSVDEIESLPS